jgi:hypothetical protein
METLYDFFAKPTDPRKYFGIRIALEFLAPPKTMNAIAVNTNA